MLLKSETEHERDGMDDYTGCYHRISNSITDRKKIPVKKENHMIKFIIGGAILYLWLLKKRDEENKD